MVDRRVVASLALIGAAALGVGMIVLLVHSPSHHTVTIAPAAAKRSIPIDPVQAKAAFDEQVAKYRNAGEWVRAEDMVRPAIDPEKNVATPLLEAVAVLDKFDVPAHRAFFNLDVKLDMSADRWKLVDDALAQLAPVLAKVDEASTRAACRWDIRYESPIFRTLLRHLNGVRGVANIVQPAALAAHRAGRDDEALHRVGQLLQIARWVDQDPFVVTHLVGLGVARMASETVAEIVPTLKIGDAAGDASEAQVRALVADFLDEAWAREGFRSALIAERLSIIDTARCLETGKLTARAMMEVVSAKKSAPVTEIAPGEAYFDALAMMKMMDPMIDAARTAQRLGQFQAKLPAQSPPPSVMRAMMPSLDGAAITHYAAIAHLRLSAIALAARMWMVEHGGTPPAALDDLVPKYVVAIPLDPLAKNDGEKFSYKLAPQPTIAGTVVRTRDRMEVRLAGK